MEAIMNPSTTDESRTPIAAPDAEAAAVAQGNAVSIVPVHHELTTQQAAVLLGVSRPHLVKLVDAGEIPHHKTGSHRRIYFEDLMRYRDVRDAQRAAALRELTRKSAEYGLSLIHISEPTR